MIRKSIKIILAIAASILALYFSFYTESLSEKQLKEQFKKFNPAQLVDYCWEHKLEDLVRSALPCEEFFAGLQNNAKDFSDKQGKVLGIGSNYFFVIQARAEIASVDEYNLYLILKNDIKAIIPKVNIFSNLARDASSWFSPDDFQNAMDFNALSSYLNKKILQEVLAPLSEQLRAGVRIEFVAAVEVNINDLPLKELVLIPYQIKIIT